VSEDGSFETTVDLNAPVQEVFRHLTDPAAMIRWMGQHATLEPAPGGTFEVDINGVPVRGRYLEVDPPRRVVVSWGVAGSTGMPPGATQVEFTLVPTGTGTRLRLVHRNLPPGQAAIHGTGWRHFLGRLGQSAAGADPGPDPWGRS
jgi:uncharacterized protein YndB with AHSA1/START domain